MEPSRVGPRRVCHRPRVLVIADGDDRSVVARAKREERPLGPQGTDIRSGSPAAPGWTPEDSPQAFPRGGGGRSGLSAVELGKQE